MAADFFEPLQFCNQMLCKDSVIIACFKTGRGMRRAILRFSNLAVSLGITGLFAIGYPAEVRAQTIFCPATFSGAPVALAKGSCTDGKDGAFSGAALAIVRRLAKYLRRRPK